MKRGNKLEADNHCVSGRVVVTTPVGLFDVTGSGGSLIASFPRLKTLLHTAAAARRSGLSRILAGASLTIQIQLWGRNLAMVNPGPVVTLTPWKFIRRA